MRTALNPKHPNNDWYEELCALSAIGELSASEFEELQKHLSECGDCRELYADFRKISSNDLGALAVMKRGECRDDAEDLIDERALLSQFLDRAQRERGRGTDSGRGEGTEPSETPQRFRWLRVLNWLRRPALSYGAIALLLGTGAAIGAYRLREAQLTPALDGLNSEVKEWRGRTEAEEKQRKSASQLLDQSESEREALQKSLTDAEAKYTELHAQQMALESQLSAVEASLTQTGQELAVARSNAEVKDKQLAQLETQLQTAVAKSEQQEIVAENLRNKLQWAEQPAKAIANPGFEDADAKNLFGARDLHIIDVYDVAGNGDTRRTYGRVYYVEKKLLIFYAFDLQDKERNRAAAGFQAWGYRQANEAKPEDLGLFGIDDASSNRWVLKVNNPRILEHIDAVFVTLEPPAGSPSPRGRKLLYANLAGPPNHP